MNDRLPRIGVIIGTSTLVRVLFAATLGFGIDEAYAVTVARPISLSYFDHAPLHFWIAAAMTWLTDSTAPLVVRLPFLGMFSVTLLAMAAITRRLFGETAAQLATVALAASGVLGMTSGSWVLPDGPLICFTALAVWVLTPLLLAPATVADRARRWRWLLGGALLGAAVAAKYHGGLFSAAIGAFVLAHRDTRAELATPWPWLGGALACSGLVPVLWWNAQHDWISFSFQAGRAAAHQWSLAPFAENVLGQLLWLLPWIAVPLWWAVARAIVHARTDRRVRLLLTLAAGPVLLFTGVTLGGARGLPHWSAPGWLFAFPLLGAALADALASGRAWTSRWWRLAPAATAVLVAIIAAQSRWQFVDPLLSARARATDPTRDALSWAPALVGDTSRVLLVRSWIQGGQLGAAAGASPRPIVCLCADPHHFAYRWQPLPTWTHATLVERQQEWKRDWRAAPVALAGDSLSIVPRDTIWLDAVVRVVRYDVTRRSAAYASDFVKQNLRPIESSDREIER